MPNGLFLMILAKVQPKFLPKHKICELFLFFFFYLIACSKFVPKSIHKIAQFCFQKIQNFPASEGGTSPVRHPPPTLHPSGHLAIDLLWISYYVPWSGPLYVTQRQLMRLFTVKLILSYSKNVK